MMLKKALAVAFFASSSTLSTVIRAETLLRRPEVDDAAKIEAQDSSLLNTAIAEAEEEDSEHRSLETDMKCRIFLSSREYEGDLDGIRGADDECDKLARRAGMKTTGKWKALLFSDQETCPDYDPNLYMSSCENGYYLVDSSGNPDLSKKVADDKKHLLDAKENLHRKINRFETGRTRDGGTSYVWTGAIRKSSSSRTFIAADEDCYQDWDSTRNKKEGMVGRSTSTSSKFLASNERRCTNEARLYCVEQEYTKEKKKYRACVRD